MAFEFFNAQTYLTKHRALQPFRREDVFTDGNLACGSFLKNAHSSALMAVRRKSAGMFIFAA